MKRTISVGRLRRTLRDKGIRAKRGQQMRYGKGWRLIKGSKIFSGTLLYTVNFGKKRIALFSVYKSN